MSLLTEKPPVTVTVAGVELPINADFRVMLRINELYEQELDETERAVKALLMFYQDSQVFERNTLEGSERMLWFLRCGQETKKGRRGGASAKSDFSFSFDAPLIYAAFLDQYGIDLIDIEFLHWWKFRALLDGLRGDHLFNEVRRARSVNLGNIKDKEQRNYYRQMQTQYAIPLPEQEQERIETLERVLMDGGDISTFLNG